MTSPDERYERLQLIGRGGMQEVFLANDKALSRLVAVKRPYKQSSLRRFAESAQLSARVHHPNLARTLDYLPSENMLIEEFVPGVVLKEVLKRYRVLDPQLSAHLVHHLALGVSACHTVGIVHRDLKPTNVLVSSELWPQVIKITDFGIARMAEQEMVEAAQDQETLTSSSTAFGALPYMAPEMIDDPRTASASADVWSLGCMLYEFLTGKLPFGSGLKAVKRITDESFHPETPASSTNDPKFRVLFNELLEILNLCLAREPSARPTASKVVERCSALCYSEHTRAEGEVISMVGSPPRAYGYLRDTNTSRKVFFHCRSVYARRIQTGARVAYSDFPGVPHPRAFPVVPLAKEVDG